MITLKQYLYESFEDNLFWKIDKYFERNENEYNDFIDLIDYCRNNLSFNKNTIEEYFNKENLSINLKKFVDFLDDVIHINTTDRDYYYILYNIIKQIIANKNEGTKYTKIREKI